VDPFSQIVLPAVADEKKRVTEDVAKDRQHAIDAAIVRTMKSRKIMPHQQVRGTAPGASSGTLIPLRNTIYSNLYVY